MNRIEPSQGETAGKPGRLEALRVVMDEMFRERLRQEAVLLTR